MKIAENQGLTESEERNIDTITDIHLQEFAETGSYSTHAIALDLFNEGLSWGKAKEFAADMAFRFEVAQEELDRIYK